MDHHDRAVAFDEVFLEVYEPLQRYLHRRCDASDVDDLLSETLLAIWRRLDDVPEGRALPWSYSIARGALANHRRGRDRRRRLVERVAQADGNAAGFAWAEPADASLHAAVERLSPVDQEVVRLWAWEQLEPREIAESLDTTANAVSVRLHRIRRRLEREIARQDPGVAGPRHHEVDSELEP